MNEQEITQGCEVELELHAFKVADCKYGENPYQTPAAFYSLRTDDPLAIDNFSLVEGISASFNNFADIDRLLQTITHLAAGAKRNFKKVPLMAIGVKHGNPCGAAWKFITDNSSEIIRMMLDGDPVAIFGGLVMTNFSIGEEEAEVLLTHKMPRGKRRLIDGIIAPSFTRRAIDLLKRKKDKCRLIENVALAELSQNSLDLAPIIRPVRGGFLKQPNYSYVLDLHSKNPEDLQVFGHANDPGQSRSDLILAWAVGATSNSNTITIVKNSQLIGNGVGQQDRVGAARLALRKAARAKHFVPGSVAYSDSFFPFTDGPEVLIDAGVSTIIASSGSIKDTDVIKFCQDRGVSLILVPDNKARGFFNH